MNVNALLNAFWVPMNKIVCDSVRQDKLDMPNSYHCSSQSEVTSGNDNSTKSGIVLAIIDNIIWFLSLLREGSVK